MARYSINKSTKPARATVKPDSQKEEDAMTTDTTNEVVEDVTTVASDEDVYDDDTTDVEDSDDLDDDDDDDILNVDDEDSDDDEDDDEDSDDEDDDDEASDEADTEVDEASAEEARQRAITLVEEWSKSVEEIVTKNVDPATGALSSDVIRDVQKLYTALPGIRAKGLARDWVESKMLDGIIADNLIQARSYMLLSPELKVTPGAKRKERKERLPKTPEEMFDFYAERCAELDLARALVYIPEEVEEADLNDSIQEMSNRLYNESYHDTTRYMSYLSGQGPFDEDGNPVEPDVPDFVKTAAKLALGRGTSRAGRKPGKVSKPRDPNAPSTPRRSPREHIRQVFADKPVGFFMKINDIAATKSEEYGDDQPSPGAISANLNNSKYKDENVQPFEQDGLLGAKKIS